MAALWVYPFYFLLFPAAILLAWTTTLAPPSEKGNHLLRLWLPLLLGTILGIFASNRSEQENRRYMGMRPDLVDSFTGVVLRDHWETLRSDCSLVNLRRLFSDSGWETPAHSISLLCISRGGEKIFHKGRRILVRKTALAASKKGESLLFCFASHQNVFWLGWSHPLWKWRADLLTIIDLRSALWGKELKEFFLQLFLAKQSAKNRQIKRLFREAGVAHMLALSGLHMGILLTLVLILTKKILGTKGSLLVGIAVGALYLWLAGGRPSLVRALLFYSLVSLTFIWGSRRGEPLRILGCCFLLVCAGAPKILTTLSFQLSFLAFMGILTLGRRLHFLLSPYLPTSLAWPLCISLGAQISVAPLLLHRFGMLYPQGVLATPLIAPLLLLFLWTGLLLLLFPWFSWFTVPFLKILYHTFFPLLRLMALFGTTSPPLVGIFLIPFSLYFLPPSPLQLKKWR